MPTLKTSDNTTLYYKDWGEGQPVVFSHGWPLNADAWEDQMLFLADSGYRCIAHDRRGHGRSDQPWSGNDMDTYADDLNTLLTKLELNEAVLVGHSTGGGEVARLMGRHGSERVSKVVLIGAVTPVMVKTAENPDGVPKSVFDELRTAVQSDRSQFFQDFSKKFYGANRSASKVSQGVLDTFWMLGMQAGLRGVYECIQAFSETDFTQDLRKIDVPALILHGDDDQIVPLKTTSIPASEIIADALLKVYGGASHGLCVTHKDQINQDLLKFIES